MSFLTYYAKTTKAGFTAMMNAVKNGEKVKISHFAAGDGGGAYYRPTGEETTLKNECWRGVIDKYEISKVDESTIILTTIVPNDVGGFIIREIGVFAEDGTLIAIGNCPDFPKIANGQLNNEFILKMKINLKNIEVVEVVADNRAVSVLIEQAKEEIKNEYAKNIEKDVNKKMDDFMQSSTFDDKLTAYLTEKQQVNVKVFGAVGDGVTDDTNAIQEAINSASTYGHSVYFPKGNYLINFANVKKGVNLVGNNATLINSSKTMIMRLYGDNVIDGINLKGQLDEALDFSTDEFKTMWESRCANGWDTLVFSADVSNITFKNCTISQNLCEGLKFKNASNIRVENCTFINTDCAIITQGATVDNIIIEKCSFSGHRFSEKVSLYSTKLMTNIYVRNNIFRGEYCNTNVILVGYESSDRDINNPTSVNVEISGNYIENCVGGIMCIESNMIKIYNNVMVDIGTRGIELSYCSDAEIYNNTITKSNYTGIILNNSTRVDIKNNHITDASYNNSSTTIGFIRLEGSSYITILHNKFLNIEDTTNTCALTVKNAIDNIIYKDNEDLNNDMYLTNAITLTNSTIITQGKITGNFADDLLDSTNNIVQTTNDVVVNVNSNSTTFSLGYHKKMANKGIVSINSADVTISALTVGNLYNYREITFIVNAIAYGFTKLSSDTLKWKKDEVVSSGNLLTFNFMYKDGVWYEI